MEGYLDQLNKQIESLNKALDDLSPGSAEHERASKALALLVRAKSEAERYKLEAEERVARRKAEIAEQAKKRSSEELTKSKEIKSKQVTDLVKTGAETGLGVLSLAAFGKWFKDGLNFEKTGVICSSFVKNIAAKIIPKIRF